MVLFAIYHPRATSRGQYAVKGAWPFESGHVDFCLTPYSPPLTHTCTYCVFFLRMLHCRAQVSSCVKMGIPPVWVVCRNQIMRVFALFHPVVFLRRNCLSVLERENWRRKSAKLLILSLNIQIFVLFCFSASVISQVLLIKQVNKLELFQLSLSKKVVFEEGEK